MEPEPPIFYLEPEPAPGPRTSGAGAAQKSRGSATLFVPIFITPIVNYSSENCFTRSRPDTIYRPAPASTPANKVRLWAALGSVTLHRCEQYIQCTIRWVERPITTANT